MKTLILKQNMGLNYYLWNNKKWFTLVELIIVVTILAILATTAFLTLWKYPLQARDTLRISDLKSIEKSLEIYKVKTWELPEPDSIDWQKVFWEWVFAKVWNLNTLPKDPITGKYYLYNYNKKTKTYLLQSKLERWENYFLTDWKLKDFQKAKIPLNKDGTCPENYLKAGNICRKIWEMYLIYKWINNWDKIILHFWWFNFVNIDWGDNWVNNCPTSWKWENMSCVYTDASKSDYKIVVKWYADAFYWRWRKESNIQKLYELSDFSDLGITNLETAFIDAINFNQNINDFDMSEVENISFMFERARKFNQPIDKWDLSNVRSVWRIFAWADAFRQDLSNFNPWKANTKEFCWPWFWDLQLSDWFPEKYKPKVCKTNDWN